MRIACALCLGLLAVTAADAGPADFPRPAALEPAVHFWTRVYTEIATDGGFIHDSERLEIIYDTLHFAAGTSRRQRNRELDAAMQRYRTILIKLATGKRENLEPEEQRVLALWPQDVSNAELKRAAQNLRFQLGQADRFRAGLTRSGAWKPHIERVLAERGLPAELAALPHVESSFNPDAYSKVGAAGMWQFTRSTGLRYLSIDNVVDERRDPFISTRAAARLLEDNYAVLGSWPLAITAYNHGLAGMKRAAEVHGTTDIDVILRDYESRTFGFASRNFYVAFLAAVDVDADPERYFGTVTFDAPVNTTVIRVPDYVSVTALAKALRVGENTLRIYNPALMPTVWAGDKLVPKDFELRLPSTSSDIAERLAALPATERHAAQIPDVYHRVRRGDTLSEIAEQYHVSLAALMRVNNLGRRDFIRAGQMLTLPVDGAARSVAQVAASTKAEEVVLDGDVYVVRAGDSIDRIARRLGIEQSALLAQNSIRDPRRIYVGQKLRVSTSPAAVEVLQAANSQTDLGLLTPDDELQQNEAPVALTEEDAAELDELDAANDEADQVISDEEPGATPQANALASVQADLAADPSDYSVARDDSIEVQALETLGHYADWLQLRTQRLRDINAMRFGQAVVIGQRIKLDFSQVDRALFEQRRMSYQQQTQEAFFQAHQIEEVLEHAVAPGESLWVLALHKYRVPLWLLRQYNPDLDIDEVRPGTVVKFPKLKVIAPSGDSQQQIAASAG